MLGDPYISEALRSNVQHFYHQLFCETHCSFRKIIKSWSELVFTSCTRTPWKGSSIIFMTRARHSSTPTCLYFLHPLAYLVNHIHIHQENPACTKNNHQDKILLTNMDMVDSHMRGRERNGGAEESDEDWYKSLTMLFMYTAIALIRRAILESTLLNFSIPNVMQ